MPGSPAPGTAALHARGIAGVRPHAPLYAPGGDGRDRPPVLYTPVGQQIVSGKAVGLSEGSRRQPHRLPRKRRSAVEAAIDRDCPEPSGRLRTEAPALAAVPETVRLGSLDVLRGLALLGILVMNIQ